MISSFLYRLSLLTLSVCLYKGEMAMGQNAHPHRVLNIAVQYFPEKIDPLYAIEVGSSLILNQIFDTLYRYDSNDNIKPYLADFHIISGDGKTIEIYLKTDRTFSDGSPLEAEHVISSLERAIKHFGDGVRSSFGAVSGFDRFISGIDKHLSGMTAIKKNMIKIDLCYEFSGLIKSLTSPLYGIAKQDGDRFFGTGFYVLQETNADSLLLKRWKPVQKGPDFLNFKKVPLMQDLMSSLQDNAIDLADLSDLNIENRFEAPSGYSFVRDDAAIAVTLQLNYRIFSREERHYFANAFYESFKKRVKLPDYNLAVKMDWYQPVFSHSQPKLKPIDINYSSDYDQKILQHITNKPFAKTASKSFFVAFSDS